jgi:hypothetical protein
LLLIINQAGVAREKIAETVLIATALRAGRTVGNGPDGDAPFR